MFDDVPEKFVPMHIPTPEEAKDRYMANLQRQLTSYGRRTLSVIVAAMINNNGEAFTVRVDRKIPGSDGFGLTAKDITLIQQQVEANGRWRVLQFEKKYVGQKPNEEKYWAISISMVK